ncbi:Fumarylacetoacetate hydrolase domain-containing protein 2-like protein [Verticillium dahliae VDG1]|nr:Fumarylacetoacetate hydrolase domain-containing protein 2-like protein [Verticillium dahliae VDG1]
MERGTCDPERRQNMRTEVGSQSPRTNIKPQRRSYVRSRRSHDVFSDRAIYISNFPQPVTLAISTNWHTTDREIDQNTDDDKSTTDSMTTHVLPNTTVIGNPAKELTVEFQTAFKFDFSIQDPARPHCHQGLAVSSFIGSLTSTLSLEANDKDISDDEIKDNRANDNDDTSTDLSTSDNVLAPEDASDEYDIADIPPLDDAFDRDVGDRNPTNEGEKADGEPVIYNTSTDDEALNFDPNDCTDASSTLNPTMVTLDSRESIITEITALRDRLTQLEAKINSGSHILQGTNPLGKRKQIASW